MCVSLIREVTVLLQQPYWFLPPIRSSRRVRSRREKKQKTPGSKKKKKKNLLVSFWLLLLLWWWRQRCWKLPLALLCTSSVAWKFPLVCVCARSCRYCCCCYWLCRRPPPRTMALLCPLPWPSMPGDSHSPWAAAADTTGHHCYYISYTFWRKFRHPTIYK